MENLGTRVISATNRFPFVAIAFFGLVLLGVLPPVASAQSTISGVVTDSSGSVMADAMVEAASDVLIERARTVTTGADGRYTFVDLRPGTYVVTVSKAGFATLKQTIVVPANVTVPVDAELKVGSVGETINVEARVATVDIENVAHPETLTRAEMDAVPTGRYMQSIASYAPGAHLNLPDIGGSQQIEQNYVSVHGNLSVQDIYMLDGLLVNTTYLDGQIQQYIDNAAVQETTLQTSNVTVDASGGGMFTNLVPKDGGNQFHGSLFAGGSGGSNFWQGNNLDKTLGLRGLSAQDKVAKIEDIDGSFGGPIMKDKLWFMLTGRDQVTWTQAGASTYPNGKPGIQDGYIYAGSLRLTYQANAKNKFSAFWLRNWKYKAHEIVDGGQEGFIPADPSVSSTQRNKWPMYYILQTKWTSTISPKLLTEVGMSISHLDYNDLYQEGIAQVPDTQAWYADTTARDLGTLRRYFAGRSNQYFQTSRSFFNGSATYVTGSHQIRGGVQYSFGPFKYSVTENGDGYSVFNNGAPVNFVALNTPYYQWPRLDADVGLYAMDTWRFKRFAITVGIRWEYLAGEIEAENAPAGRFVPARTVPKTTCSTVKGMGCWKDWTPRLGIVYDLFGNHKTALKAGFGKYNDAYSTGFTNNFNPMTGVSQNVTWNFPNPQAAGSPCAPVIFNGVAAPNPNCYATGGFGGAGALPGVGAGTLGSSINPAFGSVAAGTGVNLDPNWHRDYNYQYNAGIQQQVANGVTLNFNWYRRSQYQQTLILNYASGADAWTPLSITNPLDGTPITFYNLTKPVTNPVLVQTNAPQSLAKNVYTGFETFVTARLPRGMFGMFAWTIDRDLDRSCDQSAGTSTSITGSKLNDPNTLRYCDMFGQLYQNLGAMPSQPWQNEFKVQGAIPIRWGFVASASFYSNRYQYAYSPAPTPGGIATGGVINNGYLARLWNLTASSVYPANCVGCTPGARVFPAGTVLGQALETINLVAPGQVLTPRLNQLDLSLKKRFTLRERFVLEPQVQAFNILNSNAAVTESVTLGANAAPFLSKSACANSAAANCGLGGTVTTITNPRLLRLALMFQF
ncbi:MAG TPA: carboxypeptidase regulatory-like domain-containing protein [Bryobacteraceae bacterium]|nr:carboxypeptidase regulatory-like domain-containing protein [Bryobacteraceae bacterium]